MHAFAHVVRKPAHRKNVSRTVEGEGVVRVQSFAGNHLGMNGPEAQIIGLEWMRDGHRF